jgi:enoyl-CoA hydratase
MSINVWTSDSGSTIFIKFAEAQARNPLSSIVLRRLHEVLDNIELSSELRTVIFTGAGNAFASGANLREIAALDSDSAPDFARFGQSLMSRIAAIDKITIAAINGFCFGGALDLALACHKRIAHPTATFAHPGAGLGIITGWGGTQRLPRLIGRTNALEMFFTAGPIGARRALDIGLVDAVADNIFDNRLLTQKSIE